MRCLRIICIILLGMPTAALAFDIVGVGIDPSKAQVDALRQVAECFGQVHIVSATKVVNYQTVSDFIDVDTEFRVASLHRYYVGMSKVDGLYQALYRFPESVVHKARQVKKSYYRKDVFITFQRIGYSVYVVDSFGVASRRGFEFKVPAWVRRFVRRCIWRISDDFQGFEWVKEEG